MFLPKEIINIIIQYDGRIKYSKWNAFYIDFSIGEKYFGIIHDYNYHGNCYKISFYKDIKDTYLYKFSDYFYRFFNIYHKWFFIEDYQYE
jgi:hypothetical protein